MKIDNIQINSFGNLEKKNINFEKLNIVYGENEAGKSTLLDFIISMFYGASKNKDGKYESDSDRYKPWNSEEEFSGNLNYTLDNNKKISIFRRFKNNMAQITDENDNDISKDFLIDKKMGSQVLESQIGIDRKEILSTIITSQNNVAIDNSEQNMIIQKISNSLETGEEEVSYEKALKKLNSRIVNEVGSNKSQNRPLENSDRKIEKLKIEINNLVNLRDSKSKIEEENKLLTENLEIENNRKKILNEINEIIKNDELEQSKIDVKKKFLDDNNKKIEKYDKEIAELQNDGELKRKKIKKINLIVNIFLILLIIGLSFINKYILIGLIIPIILFFVLNNRKIKVENLEKIEASKNILKDNNENLKNEIDELTKTLVNKNEEKKNEILNKYGDEYSELFSSNIKNVIIKNQNNIQELLGELHKNEIDYKMIEPSIEKLANLAEELEIEKNNNEMILQKKEIYDLVKNTIEESYNEMKNNITPEFIEMLNDNISVFTNKKYNNVKLDNGIFVKNQNGEYIPIEKLSFGTNQEIYLALRLSLAQEMTEEKLPIILDEAFAYFDNKRLENILNNLIKKKNQIIILTCTNREKDVLDKNKIKYNNITL